MGSDVSARDNILALMHRYSFLVDRGDLVGFAGLFESAEWGAEGDTLLTGYEMLEMLKREVIIYPDGTPRTRHVVTNIELDVDEERGTAQGQSYITLFQQTDDFPLQVIFSGEYHDEFVRENDVWRFDKRIIKGPMFGDQSRHMRSATAGE